MAVVEVVFSTNYKTTLKIEDKGAQVDFLMT